MCKNGFRVEEESHDDWGSMPTVRVRIPGRKGGLIPAVRDQHESEVGAVWSRSPEWVVSIRGKTGTNLTQGTFTIGTEDNFIALYGWTSESSRWVSSDVSGTLLTSGSIQHSDLVLLLPPGPHGPKIESWLYQGKIVESLIIKRLGWSMNDNDSEPRVLQTITFLKVRLLGFQMTVRYYVVRAQITEKQNDITILNQVDGMPVGHNATSVNYSTLKMQEPKQQKGYAK